MSNLVMDAGVMPGGELPAAIRDLCELADRLRVLVKTRVNGKLIIVRPGDEPSHVLRAYNAATPADTTVCVTKMSADPEQVEDTTPRTKTDMLKLGFKPSELRLPYLEWKALLEERRPLLSEDERLWASCWESLDLALSPMPDNQRAMLRAGHWQGFLSGYHHYKMRVR